jgi:hypothetical protein
VAIAGPIASFLLAATFFALSRAGPPGSGAAVPSYLASVNLVLGAFNLVPAFPLDGGRVLRAAVWRFTGKVRATRISSGVGTFFAYLLILNGIYGLLTGSGFSGLWSILLGWFLKDAAAGAYQQVRLTEILSGIRVRDLMVTDCKMIPAHISIAEAVRDYFLRYGFGGFPVQAGEQITGIVSLPDVRAVRQEDWERTAVQAAMVPVDERSTIRSDEDIMQALGKMAESGLGRLLVVDPEWRCVGLITHNGILRRLQVQEQLGA